MTPQEDDNHIIVGQVGSPFGVKGWVKINSFTEKVNNITEYTPWYLESIHGWQAIEVEDCQEHGKGLIAKLKGYQTPEQVKLLSGKKIAVLREQLPRLTQGEYYWSDLTGLTVINQHGNTLGKVIHLMETGSNDVLVVKGDKEHAIPYLPGDVIIEVNLTKKEIQVNWEEI